MCIIKHDEYENRIAIFQAACEHDDWHLQLWSSVRQHRSPHDLKIQFACMIHNTCIRGNLDICNNCFLFANDPQKK